MTLTPTSLYAKLFIHGFSKPSYASVTGRVAGPLDDAILRQAGRDMATRYPLLGSVVQWAGPIPVAFRTLPLEVAFPRGYRTVDVGDIAADLPARFVRQLAEPPPPDATLCRFWHVRGTFEGRPASALALQVHHAIVDADSAKVLIGGFLHAYRARAQGRAPELPPPRPPRPWLGADGRLADALRWLSTARLSAGRVPDTSLVADARFDGPIARAPIEVTTLALTTAERQVIRDAVSRRGLTFGQAASAALMRAFARYNLARCEPDRAPPERVGLMVAVSPRRADATVDAAEDFGADSRALELPHALLADPARRGTLLDAVRAAIHRGKDGHNGVLLGLFYLSRLARPPRRAGPRHVRRAHVVFSDFSGSVTSFLDAPHAGASPGELALLSLDVAVSPVALDQVNVLCARYLDTTTFRVIAHAGVVDGPALTALLAEELRELAHD